MTAPLCPGITVPIAFPAGDDYSNPETYRAAERYWWHQSIAAELYAQHDAGRPAQCVAGIAGNIKMSVWDVTKYVRMMLAWGEVKLADPLTDFEPDTWVALDPAEYDRHAERVAREQRAAASRNQPRWY